MRRFLVLTFADGTVCEGFVTLMAEVAILLDVLDERWPGARVAIDDVAA